MDDSPPELLWWVIPGVLAGMAMPYMDPRRRRHKQGFLGQYNDDLPPLHTAGVRSVVSLLEEPVDSPLWGSLGFKYLSCPILNFEPPTVEQALLIIGFVKSAPSAVAVHCRAGIGRTGTVLAAILVHEGRAAQDAIKCIRGHNPKAIETQSQADFLYEFERYLRNTGGNVPQDVAEVLPESRDGGKSNERGRGNGA